MSIDPMQRAIDSGVVPHQPMLKRFEPGGQTASYELDCQHCVRAVLSSGDLDDAVNIARRHLETSGRCEAVLVTDIETDFETALVYRDEVDRFGEGSA